jgi:hypothetical protein
MKLSFKKTTLSLVLLMLLGTACNQVGLGALSAAKNAIMAPVSMGFLILFLIVVTIRLKSELHHRLVIQALVLRNLFFQPQKKIKQGAKLNKTQL